ncbi:MAG: bifunctional glutamate N-acetyltransferase/amino-acid acetyltransferase ArgJ [Kordiimonadaceae bacterium]|nr:bifunctional glutamate N-acetyltransferase/amino-acid acetyltransferase ArgJ [Kordiimonadaceae bacterium]
MSPVAGVEFGAVAAGLKYKGRPDLFMAVFPKGTAAAGVFTKSKMPAAPVDWSKAALGETGGRIRCLLVNAGNANAFTGSKGKKAAEKSAKIAADVVGCAPEEVVLASTGVIGEPLNVSSFKKYLPRIYAGLSGALWKDAATATSTTDTFPKGCSKVADIAGRPITITGIAKGSGMIAPDMATMLGFVFTNASVTPECLQAILLEATDKSFNATTVDGDTSTNDTVYAFATGNGNDIIDDIADPRLDEFKRQFTDVMINLAQQVVRDGEGASKFIEVTIEGAEDDAAAKRIALTVANSPLVKTAVAGEDANWGRVVMAIGRAGEAADRDKLQIWIGDQQVAVNGMVSSKYSEEDASAYMKNTNINIRAHVGISDGRATVWTCDLTHGYISINADYRS